MIVEEFIEFIEAEKKMLWTDPATLEHALKELSDLVYVAAQYAENLEWDLEQALRRVHKSNMSKLGDDGKPIKREDGKILKGPNYKEPTLRDLVV